MFFEIIVDPAKKEEVKKELAKICEEVYEISLNYDFLVNVENEQILKSVAGIKKIRRHYNC